MIEFTVPLHNVVARKQYMIIIKFCLYCRYRRISNRLTVDMHIKSIDSPESIDNVIIYILVTCHEQMYHLQLYWAHSIATLLWMPRNATMIVCMVETWNAFIVHLILDFLHLTTKTTPSVRPSQHPIHEDIYVDTPLPYSLITNTATQFLGRNLMRNLLGVLHMCNTVWFNPF